MAGTPTAPATATISARAQSASEMVVADRGQAEVGAVVGQAEDQARQARRRPPRDLGELRRSPARLDEVGDPDAAEPAARASASARSRRSLTRSTSSGMLDLGEDDAVEREGDPAGASVAQTPQQRVQVAHRGLQVEPRRPVEAQAGGAAVAPVGLGEQTSRRRPSPRPPPRRRARWHPRHRASRAALASDVRAAPRRVRRRAPAARRGLRPLRPSRSSIRGIGAVPPSTALRAMAASAAGVVMCACWRQ